MTAVLAVVAAVLLLSVAPTTTAEAGVDSLQVESGTVDAGVSTDVNIIADDGGGDVDIIITAGGISGAVCFDDANASATCTDAAGAGIVFSDDLRTITVGDAVANGTSGGTDLLIVTITCPEPGPATIAITAIQSSTAKTGSINCRGAANTMEATVRNMTTTGAPKGDVIANIQADGATIGFDTAFISARAKDSNGNALTSGSVLFTTSDGGLRSAADTSASASNANVTGGWATIALVSDSSTDAGDDVTVTASTAGRTVDAAVHFSGDPDECTLTADPANPAAGITVHLTVLLLDSSGGPVADGILLNETEAGPSINAVNAQGAGTFALFGERRTGDGEAGDGIASAELAVGLSGGTGIFASAGTATCSTRVTVSETVAAPPAPAAPPAGVTGFTGAARRPTASVCW